jgi:Fur family transcriptional regulator, ferric uptake regulator
MRMTENRSDLRPSIASVGDVDDLDEIAQRRLQADGQRLTSGRRLVLGVLAAAGGPVTIPEILERQPGLAQSSVYRNLAVLEHVGLVSKISMGDEHAHYELGEDLTQHHHHHLVCVNCGKVRDVTLPGRTEQALDRALAEAAASEGFELQRHRLDLVGRCAECAAS